MTRSSFCPFGARGLSSVRPPRGTARHVDPLALEHDAAGVALGQVEHVVDQLRQRATDSRIAPT
jgi:hypothetical protein